MTFRVLQWATGNIGTRSLREVIRDPELELVGLVTYDPAKHGVDAGDLCGEGTTGVLATTDRVAARGLAADCVVYMPRIVDVDDVVAMVEAGTNVVSTCVEFFDHGRMLPAEDRARLADACARSGASIFATGSSPGFISETLPYALLLLQRRVDSFFIEEYANMSRRDSPHMIFEQIGFGKPMPDAPDAPKPRRIDTVPHLAAIADAAGITIDEWISTSEVAAARQHTKVLAGELDAGTVGAVRRIIAGRRDGEDAVRITYCWYLTPELDPQWDVGPTGWRVRVRGDAPLDVDLPFPIPLDDLADFTPAYTANPAVNAIPYVCAARPGFLTAHDLPPMTLAGTRTHDGGSAP
jgi:4-hydroxy-tetrahydrodipicolinate reductase